jgi:hypothetical protein
MRRFFAALVAWIFLLGPVFEGYGEGEAGKGEPLVLYYAYNNPCELCKDAAEFYEFFNETIRDIENRPDTISGEFNVFKPSFRNRFDTICARLGIDPVDLSFPILIIGDEYLAGTGAIREGTRDLYLRQLERLRSAPPVAVKPAEAGGKTGAVPVPEYPPTDPDASTLVCFVTTACENCEKTKAFLEGLPRSIPLVLGGASALNLRYFNVTEAAGLAAVEQFFEAYGVPEEEQLVPIVFYTGGYLSGYGNIQTRLEGILASGKALGFAYPRGGGQVRGLSGLELPAIFLAGLLGGVNPCSVSMLLLLLSLLAAKKAKVLPLGLSYVASKLITYLALGLALFAFARVLESAVFRSLQSVLRFVIFGLSLLLCVLNIADLVNALRENYGAVKVQLPKGLRRFNNAIIQKTVESSPRFLMAAIFLLGVIVSAGEFLCTGQIYLATIIYLLKTGTGNFPLALSALLCYTIAAALPAALLVVLCYKGKKALALSDFARRKMPVIKAANAVLFALFAVFAIFYF